MARNPEFYIDRANVRFEAGFNSLAAQKEAIRDVNAAYELLCREIQNMYLNIPNADRNEAQENVYFGLPALHNWKDHHNNFVLDVFQQAAPIVAQIQDLVAFRNVIKNAEVIRVERVANPVAVAVAKSIRDIMAARKAQYARGLEIHDIFGKLPVYVNVHYVVNQYGTEFLRAFYYMHGVLTPLNVILAVLEAKQKDIA